MPEASEKTKLAHWRKRRGVTQEELARATGLSLSVLRRLETGRYENPPVRYLNNCALALGCKLEDLIEDEWREWLVMDQRYAAVPPEPKGFWGSPRVEK
jgi:transcriptional regulator with XRE-family HTH domain